MNLTIQNLSRSDLSSARLRRLAKILEDDLRLLLRDSGVRLTSRQRERILKLRDLELGIAFVPPTQMKQLNKTYRNKSYATDVLSFDGDFEESLGDLVLCPQVLSSQARRFGHSATQETLYIFIHGVLHLLGFDHEEGARAAQIMMDIQDVLYGKLASCP